MTHQPNNPSSTNPAALAADGILIFHALFALYAVVGAPLILVSPWFALIHVPVVLWSSAVNLAHWTCPLTPLEQSLRRRAGQESFEGGWIQHYLEPLVRPLGMPRHMELIAGFSVIIWNVVVYAIILWTQCNE